MNDREKLARAKHVLYIMSGVTDYAVGRHEYAHTLRRWARELLHELFPKSKESKAVKEQEKREQSSRDTSQ